MSKSPSTSLQGRQSKHQAWIIRTYVYSNFVFVLSTFDLFNYGTPVPLSLLETCLFFSRNFTFDSHRDLKLSRIQENVKFKYFSRSQDSFQGLFKTNFIFKDFSRLPFIFKYFSSPCEPWLKLLSKMHFKVWKPTKGLNSKSYGHLATILPDNKHTSY